MKLTKIINNNQYSLSCEVFPPKKSTSFESVKTAVESIERMHPSFMSVTYGAGRLLRISNIGSMCRRWRI